MLGVISMKIILYISFCLISLISHSQNLIKNSSFESYNVCPVFTGQVRNVKFWDAYQTADYFNGCSERINCSVPYNSFGTQLAKTGKGYIGIYPYINSCPTCREYVYTTLIKELEKDTLYYAEMSVSLADYSTGAINSLGMFFSDSIPQSMIITKSMWKKNNLKIGDYKLYVQKLSHKIFNNTPQVCSSIYLSDALNWVTISGTFKAKGGEKSLIIGNFSDFMETDVINLKGSNKKLKIYYYIDDIYVSKFSDYNKLINNQKSFKDYLDTSISLSINESYVINNLNFEYNSYIIDTSSYKELDRLYDYLKINIDYKIKITGHTDSSGSIEYNIKLSENRAKSVSEYLISKGIKKDRISYSGKGSEHPISEFDDSRNRRVEFILYK